MAGRRAAHADPHAREASVAQIAEQRPDAVVAPVPAAHAQLEAAERQIELVVHDDQIGHWNFPEAGHSSHRLSAEIHELHRLAKKDARSRQRDLPDFGAELGPRRQPRLEATRAGVKLVHHLEPQVVPVVLILRSRISKPNHEVHVRGPPLGRLRVRYFFPFLSSLPAPPSLAAAAPAAGAAPAAAGAPAAPSAGTAPSTGAASASTFSAFGATTDAMASRGSSSARTPSPS